MRSAARRRAVAAAALALGAFGAAGAATAQIDLCGADALKAAELVRIDSAAQRGAPVTISALFATPEGEPPFPALALLPTSVGLEPPECYARLAAALRAEGYATLLIDPASGSGQTPQRQAEASIYDWIVDLSAGAAHLRADPRIDPDRIGAVGWSRGAAALMTAASRPIKLPEGFAPPELAAAVLHYPTCPRRVPGLSTPMLVLHGDADRAAPVESCREMTVEGAGARRVERLFLPEADHFFDHPNRPEFDAEAAAAAAKARATFLAAHMGEMR